MRPSLMLCNFSFQLLGEISEFVSLTVKRAFWETGSFKLTLKRGMPNLDKLAQDTLLYFPDRPETMLLAEKLTLNEDKLTVDGTPLKGLCKRRVCVPPSVAPEDDQYLAFGWDRFTGSAESAYLHYAANNLTAPEDSKRSVPGLVLAADRQRGLSLPWQARFDKLADLFKDIGEATGVGWDIRPDFAQKRFVFGAWVGNDLTVGNRRAVLSHELGNVSKITLTKDASAAVGTIYAGGSGEDEARMILSVGNAAQGLARREGWTDVSGVSDAAMLRLAAERKIADKKETLTVEARDSGLCRYGRDYDVGDVVTVVSDGQQMNARLIAMEETLEGKERKLKATFGDAPLTLTTLLQRNGRAVAR